MKIGLILLGRCEEPARRRSPGIFAQITQSKYDPCFANHREISVFADVMKYHAAARNADEKTRLRIKDVIKRAPICGEFQWLIERIFLCDYVNAWFYAEDYGDHCYCLKTYSKNDDCTLFTLDTETLYAAKCVCESVMNEAKKPNND